MFLGGDFYYSYLARSLKLGWDPVCKAHRNSVGKVPICPCTWPRAHHHVWYGVVEITFSSSAPDSMGICVNVTKFKPFVPLKGDSSLVSGR